MKIAVIGVGTAGLLSLSHFCAWMDDSVEVTSIYDPSINILGIGESTTPRIPLNLFHGCGFSFSQDAHEIDATIKHCVKYVNWREHDIHSLIDTSTYGIHFNNFKLKDFCFRRLKQKWEDKFKIVEGSVSELKNVLGKAKVVVDDKNYYYDYVIDCRGYPEDYSDYTISDVLPLNHCLVHAIDKPGDWEYTYHYAHKNGWMFGIPLTTRQGWGYLYNDTITTKEEAVDDICDIFKEVPENLSLREFTFKPYYANKIVEGKILKNGNRFLFFEPLEALSSYYYDEANRSFYELIHGKITEDQMNQTFNQYCRVLENFICYIYHWGSIYDTPFWQKTKQKTTEKLKTDSLFSFMVDYFNSIKSNPNLGETLKPFSPWSWFSFDKQFGYKYFTGENVL